MVWVGELGRITYVHTHTHTYPQYLQAFQQHDVQELCRVLFDELESRLKGSSKATLIKDLFEGVCVYLSVCVCVCVCVCACATSMLDDTGMCLCVCVCNYTHTHTKTHTHNRYISINVIIYT
jgi:hypothetical protein